MLFKVIVIILVILLICFGLFFFHNKATPRNIRFAQAMGAVIEAGLIVGIFSTTSINVLILCIILGLMISISLSLSIVYEFHKQAPMYWHIKRNESVALTMLVLGLDGDDKLDITDSQEQYLKRFLNGLSRERLKIARPIANKAMRRTKASNDYKHDKLNKEFNFYSLRHDIHKYHRKYGRN